MEGRSYLNLYSKNCSIVLNNKSMNASYVNLKGNFNFYFPSALYIDGEAYSNESKLNGTGYINIDGNEKYGNIVLNIYGIAVTNFSNPNISFIKGNEEISSFIEKVPIEKEEIKKLVEILKILPIAMNEIFWLDGKGNINGINETFVKTIFRGTGKYSMNKLNGKTYLLINNKKFYENEKKIYFIPYKLIIIWAIAISLFIISSIFGKEKKDEKFFGLSIVVAFLFLAITFFLWIKQAEIIFGKSLFQILQNINLAGILFITIITIPYMMFISLIAFPIRISTSSIFYLFGYSNIGKAIGRCIGFILGLFIGIAMLPSLLNMIFSPLLRLL